MRPTATNTQLTGNDDHFPSYSRSIRIASHFDNGRDGVLIGGKVVANGLDALPGGLGHGEFSSNFSTSIVVVSFRPVI